MIPSQTHTMTTAVSTVASPVAAQQSLTHAELSRLRIPELKALLKQRSLKIGGNKPVLVARLLATPLPLLPPEVWMCVLSHCARDWWVACEGG